MIVTLDLNEAEVEALQIATEEWLDTCIEAQFGATAAQSLFDKVNRETRS